METKKTFSILFAVSMLALSLPMAAMEKNNEKTSKSSLGQWWSNLSTTKKACVGCAAGAGALVGTWGLLKLTPVMFGLGYKILKPTLFVAGAATTFLVLGTAYNKFRDKCIKPEEKEFEFKQKIANDFHWLRKKACGLFSLFKRDKTEEKQEQKQEEEKKQETEEEKELV